VVDRGERFTNLVVALDGSTPEPVAEPVPGGPGAPIGTQAALDAARGAGLAGPLKITRPDRPTAPVQLAEAARDWPVQRDAVAVDPYTGRVTETLLWDDFPVMAKLTRIGVLAHVGTLFGLASQLALLALLCWGYRMWCSPSRSAGCSRCWGRACSGSSPPTPSPRRSPAAGRNGAPDVNTAAGGPGTPRPPAVGATHPPVTAALPGRTPPCG
jgi:uncharacterized iron-regulated membrane protein